MLTIRQLAAKFSLSRATLLHYDKIGLLRPAHRSRAGYRLYTPENAARLAEICRYRNSGMAIADILRLLEAEVPRVHAALERRLVELNLEIAALRKQQQVVIELLSRRSTERLSRVMTKQKWIALLASVGLDPQGRDEWHRAFEEQSPEAHQDFLESLGIEPEEVQKIRSQAGGPSYACANSVSTGPRQPRKRAPHQKRAMRAKS